MIIEHKKLVIILCDQSWVKSGWCHFHLHLDLVFQSLLSPSLPKHSLDFRLSKVIDNSVTSWKEWKKKNYSQFFTSMTYTTSSPTKNNRKEELPISTLFSKGKRKSINNQLLSFQEMPFRRPFSLMSSKAKT